jgi:SHS2 domain-containing protein
MGFQEVPHTADCAMRVWAPNFASLCEEAARALNSAAGAQIARGARVSRTVSMHAPDPEGLLVAFLTEVVYAQEQMHLGFDQFDLKVSDGRISGTLRGAPLEVLSRPIKAVTYHELEIQRTGSGLEVVIVLDV